jgi:hypothetical protein
MHDQVAWSLESRPWKVEGGNIDCIFHCIIMFCFYYSMILAMSVATCTLCCNEQGPYDRGSNPPHSA